MSQNNGHNTTSLRLKTGLAEMLKGGVIMDVTDARQAEIAQRAGAVSVMALERVPAQIRAEGGVARMASPKKIREIMAAYCHALDTCRFADVAGLFADDAVWTTDYGEARGRNVNR